MDQQYTPDPPNRGVEAASQLRFDELLDGLHRQIQRVRATRDRVHMLLDAVLMVGVDLELDQVLRRIVEAAVSLVDAEYGALGVLGEEGGIKQFITVGVDEEALLAQVGHYPEGLGILGLLIREPHTIRLADLGQHPDSAGFPPGHPQMRSFLGCPVRVRDKVFGNLYLTDKRGEAEFDEDDETVLRTLAAAAGVAIDNARLYDEARRRERWLAAGGELTRSLMSGTDQAEVLKTFTGTVREMARADLVTLAVPLSDTADLVVEVADGVQAEQMRGLVLADGSSLAAKVFSSGETITTADLSGDPRAGRNQAGLPLGPAFLVPLGTRDHVRGVLQVANLPGGMIFSDAAVTMIASFAGHAALALEIADRRRDAEQLLVLGDRDRIARDLHDLVIQRLFVNGLTLQTAVGRLPDSDVADRIQQVVDDLDQTIRVIRTTVYALRERGRETTGLRSQLLAESEQAAETLGFTPAVRMSGLLDTLVPENLAGHLLAVAREALTNAARHAGASAVEMSVDVGDGTLHLQVIDNGRGIDPAVTRRSGLTNLQSRASELGGTLTITPNQPAGTILDWTVPLRTAGTDN